MDRTVDQQHAWMAERHPQWRSPTLIQHLGDCARSFPHSAYLLGSGRSRPHAGIRGLSRSLGGLIKAGITPGEHAAMNMTLSERHSIIVRGQR